MCLMGKIAKKGPTYTLGSKGGPERAIFQKAADVWKKDVWDFQAFSQTFLELDFP